MVRAVSKYSLLSISPPQSQFERHDPVELQPITERRTGPLHRRSSVPYICMRRGYLGLRSTTCTPREWWECGPVALGRTYLLPPLSSGGALVVPLGRRFRN